MDQFPRMDRLQGARLVEPARSTPARQVAELTGLPLLSGPFNLTAEARYPECLAAGIAPLDEADAGLRFAIAPTERNLPVLLRQRLEGRGDVALMEIEDFRRMVRRHHAGEIPRRAADTLASARPDLSARDGMSAAQTRCLICLGVLLACSAILWPLGALSIVAFVAGPVFLALVWLRCSAVVDAWAPPRLPRVRLRDDQLPVYTVLVALRGEARVARQLVLALKRFDYPADRLDIKLIVEGDDPATRHALLAQGLPPHMEIVVAPPGHPRTKPRALNVGLMEARGELLAIFDAEDRPDPRQLRLAANLFRRHGPDVACLQARLVIDNADDGFLTRMFAIEYAALFDVVNAGLLRAGLPVLLGGTSNHFRTSILRQIGGWDAWNVTEDADLAFRLARCGYATADLPSDTLEEAPRRLGQWFRQRTRWMKGFLQTAVTHGRDPLGVLREAGPGATLTLTALCLGTLASALGYPFFLFATVLTLGWHGVPEAASWLGAAATGFWFVLIAGGLVAIYGPAALGSYRRGLGDLTGWLLLLPFYLLFISAAAWAALVEYTLDPFRWNKTAHGEAETSRRHRPPQAARRSRPA